MIAGDGQRKEVDLTPPQPPPVQMPDPVCAQGIVNGDLADEAEPPPGVSPLDEGLQQLSDAFEESEVPEEGGAS